jgi:glycosyltransferase involved in cell wall biosynthesis
MASAPKISVVMPARNVAIYVDQAVRSILNQSFADFEFIIINDGSTDNTGSILDQYKRLDRRIQVYHYERQGFGSALNYGCQRARGQYIARMDADDISLPRRFERQVEYMQGHPDVGVLGTWICKMDKNGLSTGTWCPPTSPKVLKWTQFFGVCVAHPAVLMRLEVIKQLGFYQPNAISSVDVDLWLRASSVTEFGNVPEILHKYRVWPGSTSQVLAHPKRESHVRVLTSFIGNFLKIDPSIHAVSGLRQTRVGPRIENLEQIQATATLLQELYRKFMHENLMDRHERRDITRDAAKKLALLALQASQFDIRASSSLLMQALRLDYHLLHPSVMMKGLRHVRSMNPRSDQCPT